MNLQAIADELGLAAVQDQFDDRPVQGAYTSDLLSDVMANAEGADLLITIQAHKNTVAVASLSDMAAIVICNDRPIPEDMKAAARSERIAIFTTGKNQFEVSGELFARIR